MIVKFGSEVRSPRFLGHLAGYILFAITSSRVNRLCSFFNMMLISGSATNCVKGFVLVLPFKRNWPVNFPSVLPQKR